MNIYEFCALFAFGYVIADIVWKTQFWKLMK